MKKRTIGLISLVIIAFVLIGLYITKPLLNSAEKNIFQIAVDLIREQEKIEANLIAELDSGQYTFDTPLIVVDPYNCSPLTAIVLFTSDEPLNISIHVQGKTKLANVDFTFDGYNIRHMIPIYGLYADEINKVILTSKSHSGKSEQLILEIETDPLPPELAKNIIHVDLPMPEKYQEGFNFTNMHKTAFDVNGDYRWYLQYNDISFLSLFYFNNEIIVPYGAYYYGEILFFNINLLGKVNNIWYAPYGLHHDVTLTDMGNLLGTGSNGDTVEDFIYEIDVNTGRIVNILDLKHVLQRNRITYTYDNTDWFHNNSIIYKDNHIIISGKSQSSVVKLSWPDGNINWILSDHQGWLPMYQKYLLNPVGINFEWQYAQHAAIILPNTTNNNDFIDIMLFDNGNGRYSYDKELMRIVNNNEIIMPENYSRMVQYRINEKTMEVEQIWQFGKELGSIYNVDWQSNAAYLNNNNRLGFFCMSTSHSMYIEVTEQNEIVWEAYATTDESVSSYVDYRVSRLPKYSSSASNLQIGVPVKNLIPDEKMKEYVK
jgi:hypothetical protein